MGRLWLEREISIIDYSLQCLFRRGIKNAMIVLLFIFLVFAISSILFVTDSLTHEMMLTCDQLPDITVQRIQGGRQTPITEAYIPEIEKIPGVEAVEPRVWGYFYLQALEANFTIYGMDLDQLEKHEFQEIVDLKLPAINTNRDPEFRMIVGQGVFELLKRIGMEERYLFYRPGWGKPIPFDIIGTFKAETELQSNDLMVLQIQGARKVLGLSPGLFTDLAVYVSNPTETENIASKIGHYFPEVRTITKEEMRRTYISVFGWKSAFVISTLMVAVIAFLILVWDKASGLSAEEKREIGILKAIGWDTDIVLRSKMWEGLIISGISTATGILLAYPFVYWLRAPGLREIFVGWSTVYPSFRLTPQIDLNMMLLIALISIIPYMAVTLIPAWKAAMTDPDIIMRNV